MLLLKNIKVNDLSSQVRCSFLESSMRFLGISLERSFTFITFFSNKINKTNNIRGGSNQMITVLRILRERWVKPNDYSIAVLDRGGSSQMITVDYMGVGV